MKIIHKILSYLPIIIVGNWVFCFLILKNNKFYNDNYFTFDLIDTALAGFSLIHYFFYYKHYAKYIVNFIFCILAIIFLTLIYPIINENIYYYLYALIISTTIIYSIF